MKPLTELDLINESLKQIEKLLERDEPFESKSELQEYFKDIHYHFIYLRTLIEITYR